MKTIARISQLSSGGRTGVIDCTCSEPGACGASFPTAISLDIDRLSHERAIYSSSTSYEPILE